ncbi:MAG: hypothetical protein U0325_14000 [Polyangiales bacterium]
MRAENESLKNELRSTREALEHSLAQGGDLGADVARGRWSLGVRCLGGLAMMTPFLLMTALCEHRMAPRRAPPSPPLPSAAAIVAASPIPGCAMSHPHVGFERFTVAVERPATVVESSNLPSARTGQRCSVRVAPVSLPDFNCHVDVMCDGSVLYGVHPMGYAHCDVEGASPLRATDPYVTGQDGDPAVHVDLRAGRVVVEDTREGRSTRAVLRIDPDLSF